MDYKNNIFYYNYLLIELLLIYLLENSKKLNMKKILFKLKYSNRKNVKGFWIKMNIFSLLLVNIKNIFNLYELFI